MKQRNPLRSLQKYIIESTAVCGVRIDAVSSIRWLVARFYCPDPTSILG